MDRKLLRSIGLAYQRKNYFDIVEVRCKKLRERFFGFDYSIFDKTICFYQETREESFTKEQALARAEDKAQHKQAWYKQERVSIEDKLHFYQEVDVYPFRQPYLKRWGGFRWYLDLVKHINNPSILEYGCGSAVLTEYLIKKFPKFHYTVADIPGVTLDFVKWKKTKYSFPYKILTIGQGKQGIPIHDKYDLIICQDVLEHTPNPLDIVNAFSEHLSYGGVLIVDFLADQGGENLHEAVVERDVVKKFLKSNLIPVKAIDEPSGNDGLYVNLQQPAGQGNK